MGEVATSRLHRHAPSRFRTMLRNHALIRFLLATASIALAANAQTTWTGAVSSAWNNAANWSAGVPTSAVAAIIAPAANAPDLTGVVNAACLDLTIQAGASVNAPSASPLSAYGSVSNAGSFVGALNLSGSGSISGVGSGMFDLIYDGAGPYTVSNVTCNRFNQGSSAALLTIQSLHVLLDVAFQGAGVVGTAGSTLDSDGSMSFLTTVPVTTPPATIHDGTYWTSNANWQPTSGTVIIDGSLGPQVQIAAGSHWYNLEFEAQSTALITGNLVVTGTLNLRSNVAVTGTTIDLGQRAGLASSTQLVATSATLLRLHDGITSAGVVFVPNATLDADGPLTFFPSSGLALGGGTHTISGSLSMSGSMLLPPAATLVFDGSGSISVANLNTLPNVQITGTNYTILDAIIGGSLSQLAGAGPLGIFHCRVDGNCSFAGSTVGNFGNGSLDANGNVSWQTSSPTTAPPATVSCAGNWTSSASFQPASGLVVFDGSGLQSVTMPTFRWFGLRVAASSQLSIAQPVRTLGLLDVQGQLVTSGNDVECDGALTIGGTLQASSSARVRAHAGANISGSLQAAAARLDVDGSVTIAGTAALGNGNHEVSGSLLVTGTLTMPPTQRLLLDGAGSIDVRAASPIPNVNLTGTDHTCVQLTVSHDLTQQSGLLRVHDCVVQGNASFQGAGLVDDTTGVLDVRGNVTVQTTSPVTNPPATFKCGGTWTANASFAPVSGLVELNGVGSQVVTTPAFSWHNLRIAATSQVTTAQAATTHGFLDLFGSLGIGGTTLQVDGKLTLGANAMLTAGAATAITLGSSAALDGALTAGQATLNALGSIDVAATGAVVLGPGPHQLNGSLTVAGSWMLPANSETRFVGAGAVYVAPANPLPRATFAGDYTIASLVVANAVLQSSGRLSILSLRSLGTASFQGNLVDNIGAGLLDVAGSIDFATTSIVVTPPSLIRCGGAWTSNNRFLPVSGTVEMNGSQPQTMTAPVLSLAGLRVVAGASVGFALQDVIVQQNLDLAGLLTAPPGLLEIRGSLGVAATGGLTLSPTSSCTVAAALQNSGSITGAGALAMVGAGALSGAGSFPRLRIAATGTVTVSGTVGLAGTLTLASGTLDLGASGRINVNTDFTGTGGVLRGGAGAVLDVNGSVTLNGTTAHASGVPDIHCDGNWHALSTFVPPSGTVFLDNAGDLQAIDGTLSFAHLRLTNGSRTLFADVIAHTLDVVVQNGASLDLLTHRLELTATTTTVNGTLAIGAGGTLALSALATLDIAANGALRMIGTFAAPANIDGVAGSGYACTIAGSITAMNFTFAHMGPNGVRITSSAVIASAPRDLRSGWFRDGAAAAGACLLHIDRPITTQLRYAHFDDAGTVTFNVRSTGTGHIQFVNDQGNFTGPGHEDDAGNVIDWLPAQHTNVTAFTARAAVHRTELRFVTTAEIDVLGFRLQRALDLAGPWMDVAGSPLAPQGSSSTGATYLATDFAVVDATRYSYRLQEELLHGEPRQLGADFARPWPQQVGNTWVVGSNGGYSDIASAVAAAVPGGNILVQAGTYAAFTIDKPVHIIPDGSGPVVIDTTLGKLLVHNIPAGAPDLALYDLQIGNAGSPFGLEIANCDNVIVLDRLQVTTATGITGVRIDDTAHVAVQGCTVAGDPGLQVDNHSEIHLSLGVVDELVVTGTSRVVYCDVTPASQTVAPGSTAVLRAGTMPSMQFDKLWTSEKPASVAIHGDPFDLYGLAMSFRRDYLDLSFVFPIDMVLLLDHTLATTVATGLLDGTGSASLSVTVPAQAGIWGINVPLQVLALHANGSGRMGQSRDLIVMP